MIYGLGNHSRSLYNRARIDARPIEETVPTFAPDYCRSGLRRLVCWKMKAKAFFWYSLTGAIVKEAVLIAIVLWLLPYHGIYIPGWGLVILVLGVAAYSYITYRLVKPSLMKEPVVAPKAMIGTEGKVVTPLAPEGYIKVQGELWQASSTASRLEAGNDVVVVGMEGLRLIVIPKNSE